MASSRSALPTTFSLRTLFIQYFFSGTRKKACLFFIDRRIRSKQSNPHRLQHNQNL
jgi:hypothetical protein